MIMTILQILFPRYYNRVWNREFTKQMEQVRNELYMEFPNNKNDVDRRVDEAYVRWIK